MISDKKRRLPVSSTSTATLAVLAAALLAAEFGPVVGQPQTSGGGQPTIERMLELYRRPAAIPAPADNPTTRAKVALGKKLFFDPRLSGSGTLACASCHNPSLGWQDQRARGIGDHGMLLNRHTPTLLNVAWVEPLFWDGRANTLEQQATGPLTGQAEMNMPTDRIVSTVRAIPGYRAAFAAAFPAKPIAMDTITKALAAYERTIVSTTAPFDRWVNGDGTAVSEAAKRGFVIFNTKAKCAACHSGWRFTDDGFHDIGIPGNDMGRGGIVPGIPFLERAFKTPTLRNAAERAPYMHDGSLLTLEQVVEHYDQGFVRRPSLADQMTPLGLTLQDKTDLIAFMKTLSSRDEPVAQPVLPR